MTWNVLVTARAVWVSGERAIEQLEAAGCRVKRSRAAGPVPEEELIEQLRDCEAVIASNDPYNARVFAACPNLKVLARCGVGIDRIDLAAATASGVLVTSTPGAMTEAVADYTFGLILCLARRIHEGHALMKAGGWGEFPGPLIHGKTLGLVGYGQIGQAVAWRAAGFSMRILAHDPALEQVPAGAPHAELVPLETLLRESDLVSVHAPALPETDGLFGDNAFEMMKPGAFFINTARGALVDEAALIRALERKTIAGAAVDVYRREPCPPDDPLRQAPNCLLTPHNAFNAVEAAELMSELCAQSILEGMRGARPERLCNPEAWEAPHLRLRS